MSAAQYPPIPAPNMLEHEAIIFGAPCTTTNSSWTYNPAFVAKYGEPWFSWCTWNRLMEARVPANVIPRYHLDFLAFSNMVSCVAFYNDFEILASQKRLGPFNRLVLEGAWVQLLVVKYDRMTEETIRTYVGKSFGIKNAKTYWDEDNVRLWMKRKLNDCFQQMFSSKSNRYWIRQRERLGLSDLDIEEVIDADTAENRASCMDSDFIWPEDAEHSQIMDEEVAQVRSEMEGLEICQ